MAKKCANIVDIIVTLFSLITFILDIASDVLVCMQLFSHGDILWGSMMVAFVSFPALLMNAFSLIWHYNDKSLTPVIILLHFLLMAPVNRYIHTMYLSFKSRASQKVVDTQHALSAQSDVSILRLFESFLESAPQLVLQLYIMVVHNKVNWSVGFSASCSLISFTWAMTAYTDAHRRAHKSVYQRRLFRLGLHWLWQLLMTSARITAIVAFSVILKLWVLVGIGCHWLVAFVLISVRGTEFGNSFCERWLFRAVCAFIYIFVFLNLNDGKSRWRVTTYYTLILVENTAMVSVFLVFSNMENFTIITCCLVFGGFLLGGICMLVYYGYLHPSDSGLKRILASKRKSSTSANSSVPSVPQIFSIEDPSLPTGVLESIGVDLSLNTNSSNAHTQQTWLTDQSVVSSERIMSPGRHTALQVAWTSGMVSSSNSSSDSSLASAGLAIECRTTLLHRKDSMSSGNSGGSASSANQLLPTKENQLLPKTTKTNNLSKSPRKSKSKPSLNSQISSKMEEVSGTDNLAVGSNDISSSPTFSRTSWARSSDRTSHRTSLAMEFTVLGFDDSSLDQRPSDCSSYAQRPRSISPMNVSGLLQDVHSRLRATIAATIAAATANSSTESTPSKTRSLSHRSQESGQDESINFSMPISSRSSSPKHDCAFLDSGSSYNERGKDGSIESLRQREGLSSLPDILEALDLEQLSDIASGDIMMQLNSPGSLSPSDLMLFSKASKIKEIHSNSSPHLEDSTLTISKLDNNKIEKPTSYLKATKLKRQSLPMSTSSCDSLSLWEESKPLDLSLKKTEPQVYSRPDSPSHNKDSPFSDKELVTVMAKSLQSYMSGGSSRDTQMPEREGLALTIDDLRFSRETTPNRSGSTDRPGGLHRSQSASSLFHDSYDSSPASSASKMNRVLANETSEKNLSPNGLKQLNVHCNYSNDGKNSEDKFGGNTLATASHALKFIMDSYGRIKRQSELSPNNLRQSQNSSTSPKQPTSNIHLNNRNNLNTSPFIQRENNKKKSFHHSERSPRSRQSPVTSHCLGIKSPLSVHGDIQSPIDSPLQVHHLNRTSFTIINEKDSQNNSLLKLHHLNESPLSMKGSTSIYKKSPLTLSDIQMSTRGMGKSPHAGISSTKKLNVYYRDMELLQYSNSPSRRQPHLEEMADNAETSVQYVAGEYHPPLCGNVPPDVEADSIERNLNHSGHTQSWGKDKLVADKLVDLETLNATAKRDHRDRVNLHKLKGEFIQTPKQLSDSQIRDNIHNLCKSNSKSPDKLSARLKSINPSNRNSFPSDKLTEAELHHSAQKVANYFSKVLAASPSSPISCENAEQRQPFSHRRQPLQPINILSQDSNASRHLNGSDAACSPVLLPPQKRHLQQMNKDEDCTLFKRTSLKKIGTLPPVHSSRNTSSQQSNYQRKKGH